MRRFRFVQLDVFTDRAFCGNPLAVFPEADDIDEHLMQRIAREMNLSETVFVVRPTDERALRRLRIFTPMNEVPLAGHPVVGTWNLLARAEGGRIVPVPAGGSGRTRIHQELGVGVLPVDIEFAGGSPARVVMTQSAFAVPRDVTERRAIREIISALGLRDEDLDERLPVQAVSTGLPFLVVPVRTLDALGRCRVQSTQLIAAYREVGALGCYAFTRETIDGGGSAAHARMFSPDDGIIEDPATGSAAGALGAYLVHHDAVDARHRADDDTQEFVIEQGDFIRRPSRISIGITGGAGRIDEVRVGGGSVVVLEGELMI